MPCGFWPASCRRPIQVGTSEWACQRAGLLVAVGLAVSGVESKKAAVEKRPPEVSEREPRTAEQRVWFPPDFADFETAMEVTAYAGRR